MSYNLVSAAARAERDDSLHEARLLVLLTQRHLAQGGAVDGLMKLAKLDFLLRYPRYLKRIVAKLRKRSPEVPTQAFEEDTVESTMIRFRYGPWDPRYRRWIGLLYAKGLVITYIQGRTVQVALTEAGVAVGTALSDLPEWKDLAERAALIQAVLGRLSGTGLKDEIYAAVPELGDMAWGEEIRL